MNIPYLTIATLQELLQRGNLDWYKFVKIKGGEYRFLSIELGVIYSHRSMVKDGETAEGAGTIAIYEDHMQVKEPYSSSLRVAMREEDQKQLQQLLKRPFLSRYEEC